MRKILSDIAAIIGAMVCAAAIVFMVGSFFVRGESHFDQVAREFSAACAAVNGKATWNGRNWECLK